MKKLTILEAAAIGSTMIGADRAIGFCRSPRRFLAVLAVVIASASMLGVTTPAKAQNFPVCRTSGGFEDGSPRCDFANLDQCRATTSGIGGSCIMNPYTANANASANANANASYRPHSRRTR